MNDWRWIELPAVLAAHDRLLADYGGAEGVIDLGGLEGALGRPKNLVAYEKPDIADLAALYAMGAKAHAFVEGNKRTAWATARAFLRLNGYALLFEKVEAIDIMLRIVNDEIDHAGVSAWFRPRLSRL